MKIKTKFHDEITINNIPLWTFPKGLPGFEDEKQFVLLPIEDNDSFQVLQSTSNEAIALIVSNPYTLVEEYSIELDESIIELLEIKKPEEVVVLAVMTLKEPFESSTLNLQAPLIFNSSNKVAKQMILNDEKYMLRHAISKSPEKGAH